jgi:hypothetical protein
LASRLRADIKATGHAASQEPPLHIPSSLPFRVEIWNRDRTRLEETIASASTLPVAIGAYEAACKARPKDRVLLCNMAQIIRERQNST